MNYPLAKVTNRNLGDGYTLRITHTPVFRNGTNSWDGWKLKKRLHLYKDGKCVDEPDTVAEAKDIVEQLSEKEAQQPNQ
jgi:hypothetical protein